MQKAILVFTVLMFIIAIPSAIVSYRQLSLSAPIHWPFIMLCVALIGGGGLQVLAAILNRKRPKDPLEDKKDSDPLGDHVKVAELTTELSEVYGDCIYEWATKHRQGNEPFSADQLEFHLNLPRERIDMGLAYLDSARVIQRDGFGWQVDPCRQLVPRFRPGFIMN